MKHSLLVICFGVLNINQLVAQWTLEYELPPDSYLNDMAVHEPSGKYLLAIYFTGPNQLSLYELSDEGLVDITPPNRVWQSISFAYPSTDGQLIFHLIDDLSGLGHVETYIYNGDSLSQFPLEGVLSGQLEEIDSSMLYFFHEDKNYYTFYYYENQSWDSVSIAGQWNDIDKLKRATVLLTHYRTERKDPFVFTDLNGYKSLFSFDQGAFTQLPIDGIVDVIDVSHFDQKGGVYFFTIDTGAITRFYYYKNDTVNLIFEPLQPHPTFEYEDENGETYWELLDTSLEYILLKYDGNSHNITPKKDHDTFNFITEISGQLIFSSIRKSNSIGVLWATSDGGSTWNQLTPPNVQSQLDLLAYRDPFLYVSDGGVFSYDLIHIYDGSSWNTINVIDSNDTALSVRFIEVIGDDSIVIAKQYFSSIDSFYLYSGLGGENITPTVSPFVTDLQHLDYHTGYGHLFNSKSIAHNESFFLYLSGGTLDITPSGQWENIDKADIGPKGYYLANELGDVSEVGLFFFKNGELLLGLDSDHKIAGGELDYVDVDSRVFYIQEGLDLQFREANGDQVYNLTLFDTSIAEMSFEGFHEGDNKLLVNIDGAIYSYLVNDGQYKPCSSEIMIPHHNPLDTDEYISSKTVITEEQIKNGSQISFKAGSEIEFLPGFGVEQGSALETLLSNECDNP